MRQTTVDVSACIRAIHYNTLREMAAKKRADHYSLSFMDRVSFSANFPSLPSFHVQNQGANQF